MMITSQIESRTSPTRSRVLGGVSLLVFTIGASSAANATFFKLFDLWPHTHTHNHTKPTWPTPPITKPPVVVPPVAQVPLPSTPPQNTTPAIDTSNFVKYNSPAGTSGGNAINLNNGVGLTAINNVAPTTSQTGATNLSQLPVQYSTSATPLIPSPANPSNDATLVGPISTKYPTGAVVLHNVAAGSLPGDAVNYTQLKGLSDKIDTINTVLKNANTAPPAQPGTGSNGSTGATGNSGTNGQTVTNATSPGGFISATQNPGVANQNADAAASQNGSVAAGFGSVASANRSTAYGAGATASGDGSTAIGNGAIASGANSTAIGAGAVAARANQIAIGTASNTYTMPGITSGQSAAAQSGPTNFVTTDAGGNLATSAYGPANLAAIDRRMDGISALALSTQTEARQGVAAAMAMTSAPLPSAPGRVTYAGNGATYRGEFAFGGSLAWRLNTVMPMAVTVGVSSGTDTRNIGARFGVMGEL